MYIKYVSVKQNWGEVVKIHYNLNNIMLKCNLAADKL
jgi:hypothetical protein